MSGAKQLFSRFFFWHIDRVLTTHHEQASQFLLGSRLLTLRTRIMLSFPAQSWEKALAPAKVKFLGRNPAYGRVASQINDRLYLSDQWTASNSEKLKELGITHMISVVESLQSPPDFMIESQRLHIPISDTAESNILQYFDKTTDFIKTALEEDENHKVLVSFSVT